MDDLGRPVSCSLPRIRSPFAPGICPWTRVQPKVAQSDGQEMALSHWFGKEKSGWVVTNWASTNNGHILARRDAGSSAGMHPNTEGFCHCSLFVREVGWDGIAEGGWMINVLQQHKHCVMIQHGEGRG